METNTEAVSDCERCPVCGGEATQQRCVVRAKEVASCGTCGTWYRVPRPTSDELMKIYDQDYYMAWGLQEDESIARATKCATFAPVLARVERLCRCESGQTKRLLDVGAAAGMLMELATERGWEVAGVELNPYAAQILHSRYGDNRVFEGELTACPFLPGSFDAVTMTDLIEHVLDIGGTLLAAARLLAPGGVICITTPRIDSLSRRLLSAQWLHFKKEHIQYFSRQAIERALREAGFCDIRVMGHTKHLTLDYVHKQMQAYPHGILSPAIRAIHCFAPTVLRCRTVGYRCGEMLITARSASSPKS